MCSNLPPMNTPYQLPYIERESIHGAAEANGAMGNDLPQVKPSAEYSALQHRSTERKSVNGAVGSVLPPVGKGYHLPFIARESDAGAARRLGRWVRNVLLPVDKGYLVPSITRQSVTRAVGSVLSPAE
jgi:hypothetical protein